jgi:ATP-binding cassette subfamily B protein
MGIRKFYGFIKPYRLYSFLAMFLLISTLFFDLTIPRIIQEIIDQGVVPKNSSVVLRYTLLMIGFTLISALLTIGNTFLSVRVAQGFGADIRSSTYKKIQEFTFRNIDKFQTGQLITRLTSDINQVQFLIMMSLRILTRAPLLMIGSVIFLWVTSPDLAVIMLGLLPLTAVIMYLFIKTAGPLFKGVQEKLDELNQVLQENLSGIRVVKAFVRKEFESERFGVKNTDLAKRSIRVQRLLSLIFPTMIIIINLGTAAVLWFGGIWVIEGVHTVGEILAFINYLLTALFPLVLLAIFSGPVSAGLTSANRISEILDTDPEIISQDESETVEIKGKIEFNDVCFSYYEDCEEPVLHSVSFSVEPGQNVAILGATGSGKSSLVHLIPRFYDVTRGSILLDGKNIKEYNVQELRKRVVIAFQESFLFTGTIRDNIQFGSNDASEEEIIAAAKAAQAHDFIMGFSDGYDTEVGQRGANLSGGQKQRINIARALLMNPSVLILDDSTSSVDVETESLIQETLENLLDGKTSFVIAQRISTVLNADKIIVLDRGKIASEGTHEELIETSPIYKEIFESQLGEGVQQ